MKPYGMDHCVDRRWMHPEHRWPKRRRAHRRHVRAERKRARQESRGTVIGALIDDEPMSVTRSLIDRGATVGMTLMWYPPEIYEAELRRRESEPLPCYDETCSACRGIVDEAVV